MRKTVVGALLLGCLVLGIIVGMTVDPNSAGSPPSLRRDAAAQVLWPHGAAAELFSLTNCPERRERVAICPSFGCVCKGSARGRGKRMARARVGNRGQPPFSSQQGYFFEIEREKFCKSEKALLPGCIAVANEGERQRESGRAPFPRC